MSSFNEPLALNQKRRPRRPRGHPCPAGSHSFAKDASATARGIMLPGTARWCRVHDRWECRKHHGEHYAAAKAAEREAALAGA